ncbi:carbohydrate-binding module family 12 protein [Botryobasidium botryosum FD-172 SS1]|uniref:Carbohydrate-binding module family 12 protein n=1 Tax=Botryobasidium botryosum (strain FD-172 SS1) TaxID=930990 RepID=A0A067NBA5_BOTB1|nr:carbohydrate-binding module family 12 protein [Botryobasidium botryosum FD-172 SS1]
MVAYWEPGTQYDYGCIVEYCGAQYKIIQPHRSQSDWPPDCTPALWGRVQDNSYGSPYGDGHHQNYQGGGGGYGGGYGSGGYGEKHDQQQQYSYGYSGDQKHGGQHQPPPPQYNYGNNANVPQQQQPQGEKHWWENPEHRKQLEIGGGILAGAALLGGGFALYNHHQQKQQEAKGGEWAMQNWLSDAKNRTSEFYRTGPRGPYTWVLTEGRNIPQGAIEGGRDGDNHKSPLYICRAYHAGGVHVGKAGRHLEKGAVIGYGNKEIEISTYEILLGDSNAVRWVDARGDFSPHALGGQPVEGGRESDGTPLYIAQAPYHHGVHPGKTNPGFKGACIAWGGEEKIVSQYRVLVY